MSSILYYSNYCNICKKYLKILSTGEYQKNIHFICIDKRKKEGQKTFIILENEQTIILPETVTRVPALLLLSKGYKVLFGEQILEYLEPVKEQEIKVATQNNMEPSAYSFGSGGSNFSDITSDTFSYIQENPDNLKPTGNAGMSQLHNYASINNSSIISEDLSNTEISKFEQMNTKPNKIGDDSSGDLISKIEQQRNADIDNIFGKKPVMKF
jgi:hypothetical protein